MNRADQFILQELKGLDASLAEGVAGVRESVRSAVEGGQGEGEGVGASEVGLPGMVPPSGGDRTRG